MMVPWCLPHPHQQVLQLIAEADDLALRSQKSLDACMEAVLPDAEADATGYRLLSPQRKWMKVFPQ